MYWFEYPVCVPFGNTNYDVALGGAHDMDFSAPPNSNVINIVSGVVSSITSPMWGIQVGIKMDTPFNGHAFCAYLHLSAVKPGLTVGSRVAIGDLVGWVGGGTTEDMYQGTTNPTGKNFLNDSFNSSRIQVGFALMDGVEYGGIGWKNFPPVDWSLDPTPLIEQAKQFFINNTVDYASQQFDDIWKHNAVGATFGTGIYQALKSYHKTLFIGVPVTKEIDTINWMGKPVVYQCFSSSYHAEWNKEDHKTRIYDEHNHLIVTL